MINVNCLNNIASVGLDLFSSDYNANAAFEEADAVLVRSAKMHDMELPDNLLAIARAGAGVNNIPLDKCADKGIVVFNTPGANANAVKEHVLAALLLASRDLLGGIKWVEDNKDDADIAKSAEKAKKAFAGKEICNILSNLARLDSIKNSWLINKYIPCTVNNYCTLLHHIKGCLINHTLSAVKCWYMDCDIITFLVYILNINNMLNFA